MTSLPLSTFKSSFSGEIITSDHELYDQLRSAFVREGHPALIFRPRSAKDVAIAIAFAREHSLLLSVRSGGHGGAGFATNDGGLVIDLAKLNQVEVLDQDKGRVKVGAGAHWGDVATELEKYSLAISSGDTKSVGVGGLTLGGGIGWMVRQHGLALDQVVAAEVVTADGQILEASADENQDLFWAIRGGGGNFGVVTHFEFQAHPLTKVYTGSFMFSLEKLGELLKGWREYMRQAPLELNSTLMILPSFGGQPPAVRMINCYAKDDEEKAHQILEPLAKLGSVTSQEIKQKKYADVLEEAHKPEGIKVVGHTTFVKKMSDELIDEILTAQDLQPSHMVIIRSLGGKFSEIDPEATAFSHRQSEIVFGIVAILPPTHFEEAEKKFEQLWSHFKPLTTGAYINFMMAPNEAEIASAYPQSVYEKLAKIKFKYDPNNIFNQNYNIKPTP